MAVAGYNVYINGSLRASVIAPSAHLTGLAPGAYTAQVQAFDDSGNVSAETSTVSFTVPTPETAGDTFPGLTISGAQGELAIDTTGASVQGSEPWNDARTVWASWVAPADGRYAFDTLLGQARDEYAAAVLSIPNLEGYWRLNEGGYVAVDESGQARHGVYLGGHAATPGGLEGDSLGALLDGATQHVQIPDAPALSIGPTGLTVACLVRVDQPAPPHLDTLGRVGVIGKPGEWQLDYTSLATIFQPGSFGANTRFLAADAHFTDADYAAAPEWVMLLATFDPPGSAGGISLYRSNALRSRSLYLTDPVRPATPQPLEVGVSNAAGYLPGAVSDVAAWSRVLTATEIDQIYTEFAGIQNPVTFYGVIAAGSLVTPGADAVLPFTAGASVGDTLLLVVASEYNPGGNTIFDTSLANDYHRVIKSHQDPLKLGKLVVYRCDATHVIAAGDTLTVRPDNPLGVRSMMLLRFGTLGVLDTAGFALQTGIGGTPAASPAVHPSNRDDRVIGVHLELGPPGDTFNEDPAWTTQARAGTSSFDAGVPVTRTRLVASDARFDPAGFPTITLTNTGASIPAGSELHLRIAHTYLGAGTLAVASAGTTWTSVRTEVDPDNFYRHTWYRGVITSDLASGASVTLTASSTLTDYAAILDAWTGATTPTQVSSAKGAGQSMTGAPIDPTSLAGVAVSSASWNGPVTDSIHLPEDWIEVARAGTARLTILTARPAAAITHQTTFNPDDLTGIRDWITVGGYLPPSAPSGGPLTPHETNVTLTASLLNSIPLGADAPWQPVLDPTPDPARKWITIVLSHKRP